MRSTIAIIALSSVLSASAFRLAARQSLPSCAIPCLTPPQVNYGTCTGTDNQCLCKEQSFIDSSTQCIFLACNAEDRVTTEAYAQAICSAYHITLSTTATLTKLPDSVASATPTPTSGAGSSASNKGTNTTGSASSTSSASASASSPAASGAAASNGIAVSGVVGAVLGALGLLL